MIECIIMKAEEEGKLSRMLSYLKHLWVIVLFMFCCLLRHLKDLWVIVLFMFCCLLGHLKHLWVVVLLMFLGLSIGTVVMSKSSTWHIVINGWPGLHELETVLGLCCLLALDTSTHVTHNIGLSVNGLECDFIIRIDLKTMKFTIITTHRLGS